MLCPLQECPAAAALPTLCSFCPCFVTALQLAKRSAAKEKAETALKEATEAGVVEDVERFAKRTVKMEKSHIEECKRLLTLMGMPVVEAPCEAEAQCAALAKADKVFAAASEDMDTMTFGTPRLVS